MATYESLITDQGAVVIADSIANGTPIDFDKMALGDGAADPVATQTALQNERYRADVTAVQVDPADSDQIIISMTVPPESGGWWVREVGIFDGNGDLVAVGSYPDSYKPLLPEGSGKSLVIDVVLAISNTANVTIQTNPSGLATKCDLTDLQPRFVGMKVYTADGTFTQGVDCPAAVTRVRVTVVGGGGGGGGAKATITGPGGGGGGGGRVVGFLDLTEDEAVNVVVGLGGVGGDATPNDGAAGAASTFKTLSAGGGLGGKKANTTTQGAAQGGAATGGDLNLPGGTGKAPGAYKAGDGGESLGGGGSGGDDNKNGVFPGGGAGGGSRETDAAGGNGADGVVIIEW